MKSLFQDQWERSGQFRPVPSGRLGAPVVLRAPALVPSGMILPGSTSLITAPPYVVPPAPFVAVAQEPYSMGTGGLVAGAAIVGLVIGLLVS